MSLLKVPIHLSSSSFHFFFPLKFFSNARPMQRLKIIGPRSTATRARTRDLALKDRINGRKSSRSQCQSFQARSRRSRPPPFISSAASLQASEPASIQSNTRTNHRPPLYLLLPSSFPPSNRTPRSSDRSASLSRFTPMEMSAVSSSLAPVRSPRPRLSSGNDLLRFRPSVRCAFRGVFALIVSFRLAFDPEKSWIGRCFFSVNREMKGKRNACTSVLLTLVPACVGLYCCIEWRAMSLASSRLVIEC